MDLYLERPGVGIAGATPRGSFNVQEQIAARALPSGDYELWLTGAGNPANVLLASTTITLNTATTSTFIVVPETGRARRRLSVLVTQGGPSQFSTTATSTSELRVVNGATDTRRATSRSTVCSRRRCSRRLRSASRPPMRRLRSARKRCNVTPVGNPGVLELETQIAPTPAQRVTMMFTGPAGALLYAVIADDGRRIKREAKVSFMNAVSQFLAVDFVVTLPGGDPTNVAPQSVLGAPGSQFAYSRSLPATTTSTCEKRLQAPCSRDRRLSRSTEAASTACSPSTAPTRRRPPSRCSTTSPETGSRGGINSRRATCYPSPAATLHVPR